MDPYYGTYLTYLIQQTLRATDSGLTVKEIEKRLHLYPSKRERANFRGRIRLSLRSLLYHDLVQRQEVKSNNNLIFHKYLIHAKEDQHPLVDERDHSQEVSASG